MATDQEFVEKTIELAKENLIRDEQLTPALFVFNEQDGKEQMAIIAYEMLDNRSLIKRAFLQLGAKFSKGLTKVCFLADAYSSEVKNAKKKLEDGDPITRPIDDPNAKEVIICALKYYENSQPAVYGSCAYDRHIDLVKTTFDFEEIEIKTADKPSDFTGIVDWFFIGAKLKNQVDESDTSTEVARIFEAAAKQGLPTDFESEEEEIWLRQKAGSIIESIKEGDMGPLGELLIHE